MFTDHSSFTLFTLFPLQDKDAVRAAAFTLFGKLSRFGDGPSKAPFLEQVHTNLISVLLHLNEENDVIKVYSQYWWFCEGVVLRDKADERVSRKVTKYRAQIISQFVQKRRLSFVYVLKSR